jgi:hypothetical protein
VSCQFRTAFLCGTSLFLELDLCIICITAALEMKEAEMNARRLNVALQDKDLKAYCCITYCK